MSTSHLNSIYEQFLPINRKERFYTGTVLPQIILYDNFKYLNRFLNLIPGFPKELEIQPDITSSNIQFLTEFSLKESATGVGKKFVEIPDTKETPDIVMLIKNPDLYLVVIEAKMYSRVTPGEFNDQLRAQEKIIQSIKNTLNIREENIFHVGLLPGELFGKRQVCYKPIIWWDDIISEYKPILRDYHFIGVLDLALANYRQLSSGSQDGSIQTFRKNMDMLLSGELILQKIKQGEKFWVGRSLGLNGKHFQKDTESGGWKRFEYEVIFSQDSAPNRNWFSSDDFYNSVKNALPISPIEPESRHSNDEWHFSYLGQDYFLTVASQLGFGRTLNCDIYNIGIGKSGVPYKEKQVGRQINPNWFVTLKNGKNIRYKNGKTEDGKWNSSNCILFFWQKIKDWQW